MTWQRKAKPDPNGPLRATRSLYALKIARAKELGFSDRAAPLIAFSAMCNPGATVGELRLRVEAQYPGVFDDPAQPRLFQEGVA